MKNKKSTDIFLYTMLFLTWILPGFKRIIRPETAVMFAAFLVTLLLCFYIKNEKLKAGFVALVTVAVSIYRYYYLLIYIPVLILIGMTYSSLDKEKSKMFETCNTMYITAMVFRIIYIVYLFVTAEIIVEGRWMYYLKPASIISVFFLLLLIRSFLKKTEMKNKEISKARTVYVFAIVGLLTEIMISVAKSGYGDLQAAQFDFMAWFVFLLNVLYFKDYGAEIFFNNLNNKLLKFLNPERQSK